MRIINKRQLTSDLISTIPQNILDELCLDDSWQDD